MSSLATRSEWGTANKRFNGKAASALFSNHMGDGSTCLQMFLFCCVILDFCAVCLCSVFVMCTPVFVCSCCAVCVELLFIN